VPFTMRTMYNGKRWLLIMGLTGLASTSFDEEKLMLSGFPKVHTLLQ
jgi:hypothetical protein